MDNYYTGNLEIISLILDERSEDDYFCGITFTKGIHEFGKIKFYLQKNSQAFYFQQPRIISFYFPPKMLNRKDVFFHLNFEDEETNDYFGTIDISTNMLGEIFAEDKNTVIDEKKELFEGAMLHYKIYLPKFEVRRQQEKYSLKMDKKCEAPTTDIDAIIGSLFSRPEINPRTRRPKIQKKPSIKQTPVAPQEKKNILSILDFLVRKKVSIDKPNDLNAESGETNQNKSEASDSGSNLMVSTLNYLKEQNNKKHTLMPAIEEDHHQHKEFSLKIKTVIFLLIFGFVALALDLYHDKGTPKVQVNEKQINEAHSHKVKQKKKKH